MAELAESLEEFLEKDNASSEWTLNLDPRSGSNGCEFEDLSKLLSSKEFPKSVETMLFYNPDQVFDIINTGISSRKIKKIMVNCKAIRFGTCGFRKPYSKDFFQVNITELGITFPAALPWPGDITLVKMCIPIAELLEIYVHLGDTHFLLVAKTGAKYASWIRQKLGLETSFHDQESSPYFCPVAGLSCHNWITLIGRVRTRGNAQQQLRQVFSKVLIYRELPPVAMYMFFRTEVQATWELSDFLNTYK